MTTPNEPAHENRFVFAVLPWLVAATGLIVYLATLNHWVSFGSLPYVSRTMGFQWTPELTASYGSAGSKLGPYGPLFYLVSYPFRWLPKLWIPVALNMFSAMCAALTLALLARSVALLPHDRTYEQRQREHSPFSLLSLRTAWIPPVLAVATLGLQRSFWEKAIVVSGSVFDVLVFAYVVRCLLEYRIVERDSWLWRATLVYGAAMTGDWVLVGLLPLFITATLWVKGIGFFNLRFLRGVILCGLAGLLLYLMLPLIYVLSDNAMATFWQGLESNLTAQGDVLQVYLLRMPKYLLLLLATTSLLPVSLIAIRWSSYFGDPSKLGIVVTTGILHLAHGVLLVACIWVAFDPAFSPQHVGLNILQLSYLGALSAGYFAGYFLLVFRPLLDRMGNLPGWQIALNRMCRAVIGLFLFLVPAGLVWKNLPQIRMSNGEAMERYAALLTQNLPDHAVILSDDPMRLFLAQSWLTRKGRDNDYMFLDTQSLTAPAYHDLQQQRHPAEWPATVSAKNLRGVGSVILTKLMIQLSENNPVYYLHPSFGFFFEVFYPQPHGLVLELKRCPTNSLAAPTTTAAEISENESFWKENQPVIDHLLPFIRGPEPEQDVGFKEHLMNMFQIPFEPNATAAALGRVLSQELNFWAVQMQASGQLKEAGRHFETALALNKDNIAARMNLMCNKDLQAGRHLSVRAPRSFGDELGRYRDWVQALRDNGPFDDPTHCFGEAYAFLHNHLYREGAQLLERVRELVPDDIFSRIWLAQLYAVRFPDQALALIDEIGALPEAMEASGVQKQDLRTIEAGAKFAAHQPLEAVQILEKVEGEHPKDIVALARAAQVFTAYERFTNALKAVDLILRVSPTNTAALLAKGYLNMQAGNYGQAIPPLTRVLSLETNNHTARLDRAIACLREGRLDEAREDYRYLQKVYPKSFKVYYGLGEIAWQKKETNEAIHCYELYLTNAIPEAAEEAKLVAERLSSLGAGSP